jgi:hypothetical protein
MKSQIEEDLKAENEALKVLREERPNLLRALHSAEYEVERLKKIIKEKFGLEI